MFGNVVDEILGDGDEVLEVCVGVVEFVDGEFWVVGLVDVFVVECWVEFKYVVYIFDDEMFEL